MADDNLTQMKACTKCGVFKPATLEHFYRVSKANRVKSPEALVAQCKPCVISARVENDRLNPDRRRERSRKYAERHADKERERHRLRGPAAAEHARQRYRSDPAVRAKKLASNKAWYEQNRERRREVARVWEAQNAEKLRALKAEYGRWRYQNDPEWMLRKRISSGIRASLKSCVAGKKSGRVWASLLGYTPAELKAHLERQFLRGMSWENFGKWHIDHRVPLASFKIDGVDSEEFRAAWSLTNLQPLWADDNQKKGALRTLLL